MQGELRGGPGEETLAEIFENLALHQVLAQSGTIDVGTIGFVADNESFTSHDLEHFEDGGVAGGAVLIEGVVDLAHRGGLLLPEDLEEFELGFGGAGDDGALFHDRDVIRRAS